MVETPRWLQFSLPSRERGREAPPSKPKIAEANLGCPEIVVKGPSAIAIAIAAKLSFLSSSEDKTLQHSSPLIQYCYFQMLPRGRLDFLFLHVDGVDLRTKLHKLEHF